MKIGSVLQGTIKSSNIQQSKSRLETNTIWFSFRPRPEYLSPPIRSAVLYETSIRSSNIICNSIIHWKNLLIFDSTVIYYQVVRSTKENKHMITQSFSMNDWPSWVVESQPAFLRSLHSNVQK